jgi:DNA adenine methylase
VSAADTSALVGGPINRYGGKGRTSRHITPHFAPATIYAEPFFGAGSVFYSLSPDLYRYATVNDLDASLVTFFRVLRDRTDDLARACEFTPYARDEFIAALERSSDDLEEARRVWVRGRQGTAGAATTAGDWGRNPGADITRWNAQKTNSKLDALRAYAARLRGVCIDSIDGAEFVDKWGQVATFLYCDPPYVTATRKNTAYAHEMTDADHRRLAVACHGAVERGAKVAVSGYPSALYEELFAGWRRIEVDVPLYGARDTKGQRRTECLWMSYPEVEIFAGIEAAKRASRQMSLFDRAGGSK